MISRDGYRDSPLREGRLRKTNDGMSGISIVRASPSVADIFVSALRGDAIIAFSAETPERTAGKAQ